MGGKGHVVRIRNITRWQILVGKHERTIISKFRCRFKVSIRANIAKTNCKGIELSMAQWRTMGSCSDKGR